ncbi:MAG: hypothetical protein FWC58_04795 [Desulfobulbus sp.]|nr:hypothetical protein [Desulfobulbus sp.]
MQIETWAMIEFLVGLFISFLGCVFAGAKIFGRRSDQRLDEKFAAQEAARQAAGSALREQLDRYTALSDRLASELIDLERAALKMQATLPLEYVRREDYVRGQSVIEAKLDALYNKLETVQLKGMNHG